MQISLDLEQDISQVVNMINEAYKISKANFIFKAKIDENKKKSVTL